MLVQGGRNAKGTLGCAWRARRSRLGKGIGERY